MEKMEFYVSCHNSFCGDEPLYGPYDTVDEAILAGLQYVGGNVSTHGFEIIPAYKVGAHVNIN